MFNLTNIEMIDGKWGSARANDANAARLNLTREDAARLWAKNSEGTVLALPGSDGSRWVAVYWRTNDATRTQQFLVSQDCDSGDDLGWFADFDEAMAVATAALRA
jgi:hypothetical protein